MYFSILMNQEKQLRKVSVPTVYLDENNADNILIICPQKYEDISLLSASVELHYIIHSDTPILIKDEETGVEKEVYEIGDIKLLSFLDEPYTMKNNEEYLKAIVPITQNLTAFVGNIEFWLEIHTEDGAIVKTNTVSLPIINHKNISEKIPEQTLSLLDDYLIKLQQLLNSCNITLEQTKQEADRATTAANLVIELLEEWEAKNGNNK